MRSCCLTSTQCTVHDSALSTQCTVLTVQRSLTATTRNTEQKSHEFEWGGSHVTVPGPYTQVWAAVHVVSKSGCVTVGVSEVGPAKVASANVETIFSGAGRLSAKSRVLHPKLLSEYCILHYNYKFDWLRPTMQ